ncbi:hypothetical protein MHF_0717 [Mycoplasma haemofelis Ohio2]|uniref:Uncharacterized protein n=1 Tax=Mycoplasma haemofelis (strain Ohio2) TaxID=859194 RepID=F6FID9_MYCHI|nr:hypothetical protein MHF_0717 [Mycoplasma haemofelis Ohio2]
MLIGGLSKSILGVSVAAGTGIGLGSAALASQGFNASPKREGVSLTSQNEEVPPARKGCKIYKIESSSDGRVTRTNEQEIEKELESNLTYYQEVKNACDKANGGNVFLSKKDKKAWRYYDEEQNHSTVKNYLQKHPNT